MMATILFLITLLIKWEWTIHIVIHKMEWAALQTMDLIAIYQTGTSAQKVQLMESLYITAPNA